MQAANNTPTIKWAQRKDRLYITIDIVNVQSPIIDIVDGKYLKFKGTADGVTYAFNIEFYEDVLKEESKYNLASRNIFLNIIKKTKGPYWPRLLKDTAKLSWIQNDWMYYIDEDEEDEDHSKPKFGEGQDFAGDMGNMEMDDNDDLPQEKDEHVHGEGCHHDEDTKEKGNIEDLK